MFYTAKNYKMLPKSYLASLRQIKIPLSYVLAKC